jgi:hypothetical protein
MMGSARAGELLYLGRKVGNVEAEKLLDTTVFGAFLTPKGSRISPYTLLGFTGAILN